jgi:glycerol-3-phosphate dehydrogenase
VIDPWSAPLAYALQGLANGGVVRRNAEVTGGVLGADGWTLEIKGGAPVRSRIAVNCAGNYGDLVEAIARPSPFTITPRKGQFVVYDKPAYELARSIILPVPTARTKGIVITRTAYGNLLVGPTAEDQADRRVATVERTTLQALMAAGERMLPGLAGMEVTTAYAGLRPATQFKDYQIEALADRRWITVAGIRSTGLTGALGIARQVRGLYEAHFGALFPLNDPVWPEVPNLTEALARPYAGPGRSEMICHCELVTRDEIVAALAGPLPAGTIGGLRRRTRCMMGRCQGFYCSRRVLELAAPFIPGLADA